MNQLTYCSTETGRLATSGRPEGDKAWNYIRVLPPAEPYTIFDEVAPGLFECVALDGLPSKSTTNSDNPPGSFRTRDLFTQHPTRPNLWKFACRLDDRFTLINGEKVLPIPIEGRIRQEEIVKEAIVFGDGRTYPGILIVKADRVADMPDDEFLDAIWPSVEDANSRAESFSRIPKELVVIVPADSAYPRTDKGTFIRVPTYRQFEKEIEAAYNRYEGQGDEAGSLTLEGSELEDYLLQQLKSKCGANLESSEADFFASGVDSLQCIQMWSLIKREIDLGGRQSELGQNVLYETGNAKLLARQIERLRSGAGDETQDQLKIMEGLIEKYSSFKRHVPGSAPQPEKELVVSSTSTLYSMETNGLATHWCYRCSRCARPRPTHSSAQRWSSMGFSPSSQRHSRHRKTLQLPPSSRSISGRRATKQSPRSPLRSQPSRPWPQRVTHLRASHQAHDHNP